MALTFVGKTWEGAIPHFFKPKKKTIHQPELTTKADLALKDLLHSGGYLQEHEIAKMAQKFLPGGAAMKHSAPNIQQIPKKGKLSGKLAEIFVGVDPASEDGDHTAIQKFIKSKEGPVIPMEHAIASHVVGEPIPYDPKAPLEINWDALDPLTKKMVQDKQQEIEDKMVEAFEAGILGQDTKLHTKELIAETHIPYSTLHEHDTVSEWSQANHMDDMLAKLEEHYGLVPKDKQDEEPEKADLVYQAFELLKQAGVYIKSGDVHYEAKEITSGTLELDLHSFGSASAFTLALDMLTHKVKPQ